MDGGKVSGSGDSAFGKEFLNTGTVGALAEPDDVHEPAYSQSWQSKRGEFKAGDIGEEILIAFGGGATQSFEVASHTVRPLGALAQSVPPGLQFKHLPLPLQARPLYVPPPHCEVAVQVAGVTQPPFA